MKTEQYLFFIGLFIWGCTPVRHKDHFSENIWEITASFEPAEDFSKVYAKFTRKLNIVPLELKPGAELSQVTDFDLVGDEIFIYQHNKPVFVFDTTGKFLRTIGEPGEGKGRFEINNGFFIYDSVVYIYSYSSLELFRLRGEYIRSIPVAEKFNAPRKLYGGNFARSKNYFYFFDDSRHGEYLFYIFDTIGHLLNKRFKNTYLPVGVAERYIKTGTDELLMLPPNCVDTIFMIKEGNIFPHLYINFGNHANASVNDLPGNKDDMFAVMKYCYEKRRIYAIFDYCATRNHVFYSFDYLNKSIVNYHDVQGRVTYALYGPVQASVFNPLCLTSKFKIFGNKLLMFVDAYTIRSLLDKDKWACDYLPEDEKSTLIKRLSTVKDMDNPVLYMLTLK